jgi:translation initiation factor 1
VADDDLASIAGLPEELGIDEELDKEAQQLNVRTESRRYGKAVTIVDGFSTDVIDLDDLASRLKKQLATGGTVEDGTIELQGDHTEQVPDILRDEGFQLR